MSFDLSSGCVLVRGGRLETLEQAEKLDCWSNTDP